MSEKRFEKVTPFAVNDTWDNHRPIECASSLDADVVCHYLNEQQATIQSLKEENEQLRKELDNFKPIMFQDVRKGTVILYSKGD